MKRYSAVLLVVAASILTVLVSGSSLFASVTGRISGTVTDSTGAVIPRATVTVINTGTGIQQKATTDARGFYAFPALPVGRYEIRVRQSGFKDYRQTGLVIDVNTELRADVTLQVGRMTQQVTVSSAAVHVETERTELGEVITGTHMTAMPLDGRGYTDLMALQPDVVPVRQGNTTPHSPRPPAS